MEKSNFFIQSKGKVIIYSQKLLSKSEIWAIDCVGADCGTMLNRFRNWLEQPRQLEPMLLEPQEQRPTSLLLVGSPVRRCPPSPRSSQPTPERWPVPRGLAASQSWSAQQTVPPMRWMERSRRSGLRSRHARCLVGWDDSSDAPASSQSCHLKGEWVDDRKGWCWAKSRHCSVGHSGHQVWCSDSPLFSAPTIVHIWRYEPIGASAELGHPLHAHLGRSPCHGVPLVAEGQQGHHLARSSAGRQGMHEALKSQRQMSSWVKRSDQEEPAKTGWAVSWLESWKDGVRKNWN